MRRREFITLFGGAAVAFPLAARAQHGERVRRIGVLMSYAADDPAGQTRLLAFAQALAQLGWSDGRNPRIDIRWIQAMPSAIANTRRNCSRLPQTPSLQRQSGSERIATDDACGAHRVRERRRSGGPRFRREPVAAEGHRHWFYPARRVPVDHDPVRGGSLCASSGQWLSTTARISSEMTITSSISSMYLCSRRRSAGVITFRRGE